MKFTIATIEKKATDIFVMDGVEDGKTKFKAIKGFRIVGWMSPLELYVGKFGCEWVVYEARTGARAFPAHEATKEALLELISFTMFHRMAVSMGKDREPSIGIQAANLFIRKHGGLDGCKPYDCPEIVLEMSIDEAIKVLEWFHERASKEKQFAEYCKSEYRDFIDRIPAEFAAN